MPAHICGFQFSAKQLNIPNCSGDNHKDDDTDSQQLPIRCESLNWRTISKNPLQSNLRTDPAGLEKLS